MPRPLARLLLAAALTAAAVGGAAAAAAAAEPPIPSGAPAPAGEPAALASTQVALAAAQARLAAANEAIAQVAVRLQDGTARWQDGVDALGVSQTRTVLAQQSAEQAAAQADRNQHTLNDLVAERYRFPQLPAALLLLGGGVSSMQDAVHATTTLDQVRDRQQGTLEAALGLREHARQAAGQAQRLRDADAARERALAADLAGLQALAERTNDQVQAAASDVDRLQAQRDAEVAAELARRQAEEAARQARLAQQQAAEQRAAQQRAVLPPAGAPAVGPVTGGADGCAGRSTSGYANGNIPLSALCPLRYAPGQVLRADAAAAFNQLTEAYRAARGTPICVTDAYRNYATQVRLYATKPSLAAVPGTSNHGWGVATDLCGGIQDYGTPAYVWMKANAPRFGWIHPAWAEPGGSRQEPWHWEFTG